MVVGWLYDDTNKELLDPYYYGTWFIIGLALITFIFAILLYIVDSKNGRVL